MMIMHIYAYDSLLEPASRGLAKSDSLSVHCANTEVVTIMMKALRVWTDSNVTLTHAVLLSLTVKFKLQQHHLTKRN